MESFVDRLKNYNRQGASGSYTNTKGIDYISVSEYKKRAQNLFSSYSVEGATLYDVPQGFYKSPIDRAFGPVSINAEIYQSSKGDTSAEELRKAERATEYARRRGYSIPFGSDRALHFKSYTFRRGNDSVAFLPTGNPVEYTRESLKGGVFRKTLEFLRIGKTQTNTAIEFTNPNYVRAVAKLQRQISRGQTPKSVSLGKGISLDLGSTLNERLLTELQKTGAGSRVVLTSPFLSNESVINNLTAAASRGASVEVILSPGYRATNKQKQTQELLASSGINVYTSSRALVHQKSVAIYGSSGSFVSHGSSNISYRTQQDQSIEYNVSIYGSAELTAEIFEDFDRQKKSLRRINKGRTINRFDTGEFGYLRKARVQAVNEVTKARLEQSDTLPYYPTSLPEEFFDRYIGSELPRYVSTSATYELLSGESAPSSLITFDREVGRPSIGHQFNRLLGFKFYHEGYGLLGSAAKTAGRFLDTLSGFHIYQAEEIARSGRLDGTPTKFHRNQYRDNTLEAGPFEKILGTGVDAAKGISVAVIGYGATFATQLGLMALQERGLTYLSTQAENPSPLHKFFGSVFATKESKAQAIALEAAKKQNPAASPEELFRLAQLNLAKHGDSYLADEFLQPRRDYLSAVGYINALRQYESSITRTFGSSLLDFIVPSENKSEALEKLADLADDIKRPIFTNETGIQRFGRDRVRELASRVDKLASFVPANPLYWIPAMRNWVGLTNVSDRSLSEVYGTNLLESTILKFDTIARVSVDLLTQPVESYRSAMRLFTEAEKLTTLEQQYTKELRRNFENVRSGRGGLAESIEVLREISGEAKHVSSKSLAARISELNSLNQTYVAYAMGSSTEQLHIGKESKFNRNIRTLLLIGGALVADQVTDQFILRTQGASLHTQLKVFDAVRDRDGQVIAYKFNGTMPVISTLAAAGVSGIATGTLFPYFAKTKLSDTELGKTLDLIAQETRSSYNKYVNLRKLGLPFQLENNSGLSILTENLNKVLQTTENKITVKAKFNIRSAAVGAVFGLMAAKLGYSAVASVLNTVHNKEAGLALDPQIEAAAGKIKAVLRRTSYTVGGGPMADVSSSSVISRAVLGELLEQLQSGDPTAGKGMQVFNIAQQTNMGFVQMATLIRTDPTSNVSTLSFGMQLLPMLGIGVTPTLPIGLRVVNKDTPPQQGLTSTEKVIDTLANVALLGSLTYVPNSQLQTAVSFLGASTIAKGIAKSFRRERYGGVGRFAAEADNLRPAINMVGSGFNLIESFTANISGLSIATPQAIGQGLGKFFEGSAIAKSAALRRARGFLPYYLTAAAAFALTDPAVISDIYGSEIDFESPVTRAYTALQLGFLGYGLKSSGIFASSEDVKLRLRQGGATQKAIELIPGVRAQQEVIAESTNLMRRSGARLKVAGALLTAAYLGAGLTTRMTGELLGSKGLEGLYAFFPDFRFTGVAPENYERDRGNPLRAILQTGSSFIKNLTGINLEKLTGLYTDTPNLFSPLLYPTGISIDQKDANVRFYSQLASPSSDLSYSSYGLLNFQLSKDTLMQISSVLGYNIDRLDTSPTAAQEILRLYRGATARAKGSKVSGFSPYERAALTSPGLQRAYARRQYRTDWLKMQRSGELALDLMQESFQLGRRAGYHGLIPYQGYDPMDSLSIMFAHIVEGKVKNKGSKQTLDELAFNITSQYYFTNRSGFFTQLDGINRGFTTQSQTPVAFGLLGGTSLLISAGTFLSLGFTGLTLFGGVFSAFSGETPSMKLQASKELAQDFNRIARSGKFEIGADATSVVQVFTRNQEVITAARRLNVPADPGTSLRGYLYNVRRSYSDLVKLATAHFQEASPAMDQMLSNDVGVRTTAKENLAAAYRNKIKDFLQLDIVPETGTSRASAFYGGDDFLDSLDNLITANLYNELDEYAEILNNNRKLPQADKRSRLELRRAHLEAKAFERHLMRLGDVADTRDAVSVDKVLENRTYRQPLRSVSKDILGAASSLSYGSALYMAVIKDAYTITEASAYVLSSHSSMRDKASIQLVRALGRVGIVAGLERLASKTLFGGKSNLYTLALASIPLMVNYEDLKKNAAAQLVANAEKSFTRFVSNLVSGTGDLLSKAVGPAADFAIDSLFNPLGEKIAAMYEKGRGSFLMAMMTTMFLPDSLYKQQIYKEPVRTWVGSEPFTYSTQIEARGRMAAGLDRYIKSYGYVGLQANLRGAPEGFLDEYASSRYFKGDTLSSFSIGRMNNITPSMRLALERRQSEADYAIYGAQLRRPEKPVDYRIGIYLQNVIAMSGRLDAQLGIGLLSQVREEAADISIYVKQKAVQLLKEANAAIPARRVYKGFGFVSRIKQTGAFLSELRQIPSLLGLVRGTVNKPQISATPPNIQSSLREELKAGFSKGFNNIRRSLPNQSALEPFRQAADFFAPVYRSTFNDLQRVASAVFLGVGAGLKFIAGSILEGVAGQFSRLLNINDSRIGTAIVKYVPPQTVGAVPQIMGGAVPTGRLAPLVPITDPSRLLMPAREPIGLLPPGRGPIGLLPAVTTAPTEAQLFRAQYARYRAAFNRYSKYASKATKLAGSILKDYSPFGIEALSLAFANRQLAFIDPKRSPGESTAASYRESLGTSFATIAGALATIQGRSILASMAISLIGLTIGDRMGYRIAQYDVHKEQDSRSKLFSTSIIAGALSLYATAKSVMIGGLSRSEVVFEDDGPKIRQSRSLKFRLRMGRNTIGNKLGRYELYHEEAHLRQAERHLERFGTPGFNAQRDLLSNARSLRKHGVLETIDRMSMRSAQGKLASNVQIDPLTHQQIYEQEFEANRSAFLRLAAESSPEEAAKIVRVIDEMQGRARFSGFVGKDGLFRGNLDKLGQDAVRGEFVGSLNNSPGVEYVPPEMRTILSIHNFESGPEDPLSRATGYQRRQADNTNFDKNRFITEVNTRADSGKTGRIKGTPRKQTLLFFDLETSFKSNELADIYDPNSYPHIGEIAYKKISYDVVTGDITEIKKDTFYVKDYLDSAHEKFSSTVTKGKQQGMDAPQALARLLDQLDDNTILVGHNIAKFDLPVLKASLQRLGMADLEDKLLKAVEEGRYLDTLNDIDYKLYAQMGSQSATLGSIYQAVAGKELRAAHTAAADVGANIRIYRELLNHVRTSGGDIVTTNSLSQQTNVEILESTQRLNVDAITQIEAKLQNPDLSAKERKRLEASIERIKLQRLETGATIGGGRESSGAIVLRPKPVPKDRYAGNVLGGKELLDIVDPALTLFATYRNKLDYFLYMLDPRPTDVGLSRATAIAQTNVGLMQGGIFSLAASALGLSTGSRALAFSLGFMGPMLGLDITMRGDDYISEVTRDVSAYGIMQPGVTPELFSQLSLMRIHTEQPKEITKLLKLAGKDIDLPSKATEYLKKFGLRDTKAGLKIGLRFGAGYLIGSTASRKLFGYGYTRDEGTNRLNQVLMHASGIAGGLLMQRRVNTPVSRRLTSLFSRLRARLPQRFQPSSVPGPSTLNYGRLFKGAALGGLIGFISNKPEDSATDKLRNVLMGLSAYPVAELVYRLAKSSIVRFFSKAQVTKPVSSIKQAFVSQFPALANRMAKGAGFTKSLLTGQVVNAKNAKKLYLATGDFISGMAELEYKLWMNEGLRFSATGALVSGLAAGLLLYALQNDNEKNVYLATLGGVGVSALMYSPQLYKSGVAALALKSGQTSTQLPATLRQFLSKVGSKLPVVAPIKGTLSKLFSTRKVPFAQQFGTMHRFLHNKASLVANPLAQGSYIFGAGALGYFLGDIFDQNEQGSVSYTGVAGAAAFGSLSAFIQAPRGPGTVSSAFSWGSRYLGLAGLGTLIGFGYGNLVDDDPNAAYPIVGGAIGLGLAYLVKPAMPKTTRAFSKLFVGAKVGGARYKFLDYLLRQGSVLQGAIRAVDIAYAPIDYSLSLYQLSRADRYSGATREAYVKSAYTTAQQGISFRSAMLAFKTPSIYAFPLIIASTLLGNYFGSKRGEFLARAKATETDLIMEAVSSTITSLRGARLIRNLPGILDNLSEGAQAGQKFQKYVKGLQGAAVSRILDYKRDSKVLEKTRTLFEEINAYNEGLIGGKGTRALRRLKVMARRSKFAKLANQAITGMSTAAKGGLNFLRTQAGNLNKFGRAVSQSKWAKASTKTLGKLLDVVDYGIGGYEVLAGSQKLGKLDALSSKEEYVYAYQQIGSGSFRIGATPFISAVSKPLMLAGLGMLGFGAGASATGIGAPVGIPSLIAGGLLVGAGLALDVFGSDIAAFVGRQLGGAYGNMQYYRKFPDRFKRDFGGWLDKMMGRKSRTREDDERILDALGREDKLKQKDKEGRGPFRMFFRSLFEFALLSNPFAPVINTVRGLGNYIQSQRNRSRHSQIIRERQAQSDRSSVVSLEMQQRIAVQNSPAPRQMPLVARATAPVKVRGQIRSNTVATTRNNPDTKPQQDSPLAQVRAYFDESRNTVVISRHNEADAYQALVNSPQGISLETAEVRV